MNFLARATITSVVPEVEVTETWNHPGISSGMRLRFANGFGLSIARGMGTYGGKSGLFEALPLDTQGEFIHDEIRGWLSVEDVQAFCKEIADR